MMSEKYHDSFGNLMNVYLNNTEGAEVQRNAQLELKHAALNKRQQQAQLLKGISHGITWYGTYNECTK